VSLTDDITDPRLAKALAHPLRLEILRRLGDRTASPSEIAAEIGAPLTNVSYHVRKLRALGLIKLVRKTPKRGVIEHYYSAQSRRAVTDEAWAATPAIVKQALVGPTAERGVSDMAKAARDGGFDRRDAHLSTTRMKLDEAGWKEAAEILLKAFRDLETIEVAARERLDKDPDAQLVSATSVISLFENDGVAGQSG
jgi:DNA-binding transcriptional ArsR family regulator